MSGQGRRKGVRRAFNGSSVWRKRRVSCAAASGSGDIRAMSGVCLPVCCLIRTGPDCRWVPRPIVAFDQCLTSRRPGIERQPILDRSWVVLPLSSRDRLTASGAAFRCLSFICAGVWSQHTASTVWASFLGWRDLDQCAVSDQPLVSICAARRSHRGRACIEGWMGPPSSSGGRVCESAGRLVAARDGAEKRHTGLALE